MADMRDELLNVLSGLSIFVLEGQIDFFEQLAQDVKLILDASDH
jgi:hypothetical protein